MTNSFQRHFQIWLAIVISLLLPTLYTTFRVRLLNLSLDPQQIGLVSQLQWLALVFEVFSDSFLPLLAFHFGAVLHSLNRLRLRIANALTITALL